APTRALVPLPAALVPEGRRAVQLSGRAGGAVVRVLAARGAARRGRGAARVPGVANPEREPLVLELAHDRAHPRLLRRFAAPPHAARVPRRTRRASGGGGATLARAAGRRQRAGRAGRRLSVDPVPNLLSSRQMRHTSFNHLEL